MLSIPENELSLFIDGQIKNLSCESYASSNSRRNTFKIDELLSSDSDYK